MPALRGKFGDWVYYACLMPAQELAARVSYADEIHPNKALSELIQRSLEGARAKQIAEYLSETKERFFSSLVLATYGGSPDWLEVGNFRSSSKPDIVQQISETALDSLGFLRLSGSEKMFAVDGQHRLAGIKKALSEAVQVAEEQVPVILVGHRKDAAGLQRTRRLFTTLNKTAVPVRKRDIIALDEDDVMAITARRLVETNAAFKDPKIAVISSQNIPKANRVCLTTIASLYDILRLLFRFQIGKQSDRSLRFNRPSDDQLNKYYDFATTYFETVGDVFKPVGELFRSKADPAKITMKQRGPHGGHLLFRPVGLEIFTRAAIEVTARDGTSLAESVRKLGALPTGLAEKPYRGVLWEPVRKNLIVKGKSLALDLIRYMVGLNTDVERLAKSYNEALGISPDGKQEKLPGKLP
jgi:DNA sulfur modification protein DndB